jgi:hypothetical protein
MLKYRINSFYCCVPICFGDMTATELLPSNGCVSRAVAYQRHFIILAFSSYATIFCITDGSSHLLMFTEEMYTYQAMYMYVYTRGGPIGPCTATYSGLLCFPFYSSPQKSRTSNEMQDLLREDVEIVTWIHKILAQVTQSLMS